jgi:hypothetical protein
MFCVSTIDASATEAVAKKRATLRSDPSAQRPPIAIILQGEDVELIEPAQTSGYFHVRTAEREEGWVYARNLEIVTTPSAVTTPTPPGGPATTAPGGISSGVSPDWEKPAPNTTTYDGPDGHCGPTGDGGDAITNARKNRTDVPAQYHEVTWQAIQSMPYPVAPRSLANWTPDQLAQIAPYQGAPVSVTGYLTAIKVEDRGSGESTNCHFTNAEEVDWHMPLVEHQGYAESTSIVVETTPRVRKHHPKWTPTALAPWVASSAPVRISGWTLFDPEHRAHIGKYRSTLWEVHPITGIEVFKDGHWVDVDDLP